MKINIREDSVEIEGYVNAVERNSKPLLSRMGKFIERIKAGAFARALKRNDDVHVLLNHDWQRDLGSTKQGNLELAEDNIGLRAKCTITDSEVMEMAKRGDLVGWSFGFYDRDVKNGVENGMLTREVNDLDLEEVSILDRSKVPAYDGTLIMARSEDSENGLFLSESFDADGEPHETRDAEQKQETQQEPQQETQQEPQQEVNYDEYKAMIAEMKEG